VPSPAADGSRSWIPPSARALRHVLVVLLGACAVLTVIWLPALRAGVASGRWPRAVLAIPPGLLALFIGGYATYRFTLVRAGRYPAGKALAQVGLMLLALGVVAGVAREVPPAAEHPGRLARALRSGNPELRAMAAELARHRPPDVARPLVPRLIELLDDPDPSVRREAHESLVALSGGEDLGAGKESQAAWRARWADAEPKP
jgi:hypothetical protein